MKIITIIGARPQFIKAAVVSRAFDKYNKKIEELIVHTGQHYDSNMSDVFFEELNIPKPDYHLGVGGGTHGQNTGRMLEAIETVLLKEQPDWVLVYGDTDSTLSGALAAAKLCIPIAHVEAGLRSFNRNMPEEINRILTDHVSNLLFTPTQLAVNNLNSEGIQKNKIHNVGDVMFDATLYYSELAKTKSKIHQELSLQGKDYILATVHRAENTDNLEKFTNIIDSLIYSSEENNIVFPLHPRTKAKLNALSLLKKCQNKFTIIDPVGYLDMLLLEKGASVIVTDSGGVQKESYFQNTPCVTIRNETEWVELIENGVNVLVKQNELTNLPIIINSMKVKELDYSSDLYGQGDSSDKIVEFLVNS